jgi:hypothetical protein
MFPVSADKLLHPEKQKNRGAEIGIKKILQVVPETYGT